LRPEYARTAPKISIEMRQKQLNGSRPGYVRTTITPILEELATEFWVNENRIRVDGDELVEWMIRHVEGKVRLDEDVQHMLQAKKEVLNQPPVVEHDIRKLRADCDSVADKLEDIWEVEKSQAEKRRARDEAAAAATKIEK